MYLSAANKGARRQLSKKVNDIDFGPLHLRRARLPLVDLEDKVSSVGLKQTPKLWAPAKWKDCKVPLWWNEHRSVDYWSKLLRELDVGAVIHFGVGMALPIACALMGSRKGTKYVGLCNNSTQQSLVKEAVENSVSDFLKSRPCMWSSLPDAELYEDETASGDDDTDDDKSENCLNMC